jgi:anti-anti-sigma factor
MDAWDHPRPPAGAITIEHEGSDRRVLWLRGDLDTAVATDFTNSHRRERIAVDAIDAEGVTFLSSSALALLLRCVEASVAAGLHPVLRATSRQVDRALQLSGIESVFTRPGPDLGSSQSPGGAEHPG